MKCKNCGHEIQQGDLFCENCGAKIEPELTRSSKNAQNKQSKGIDVKIIIIAVIAVLVIGGGGFFVYQNFIANDKPEYTAQESEEDRKDSDSKSSKLKVSPDELEIEVGENQFLDCNQDNVTYKSKDRNIATVSDSGRVKGIKAGETEVTVTYGDQKVTCKVVVKEDATAALQNSEDYVFPNSNTQLLTEADLQGKTAEQLRIGRNEIYARHGRKFNDEALQNYFNSKSWYSGTVEADAFDEGVLNEIEKKNVDFITSHENR